MAPFEVIFPGNKKVDVTFKDFLIRTDQSKKNEGDETAPEPFTLFLASLGACAVKKQLHPDIAADTRVAYLES